MIGTSVALSVVLLLGWLLLNWYGFRPALQRIGRRRALLYAAIWCALFAGLTLIVLWSGLEFN